MKTRLVNFVDATNGIAISLIPETPIEEGLLKALWSHGQLRTCYPDVTTGGMAQTCGFEIVAFRADPGAEEGMA